MKARDLLNHIQHIIDETDDPTPPTGQAAIYRSYTIRKIMHILTDLCASNPQETLDAKQAQEVSTFLAERWSVIAGTDEEYMIATQSKANIICLVLAQYLEPFLKKPRYQILMPTIKVISNEASMVELKDDNFEMHQFVLNDDKSRFLPILPCIESAIEDGILKYDSLFDGDKIKKLSDTESDKIINHSKLTHTYWQAIQQKIEIELKGESFGAVLTRLVHQLEKGGAHGGQEGKEFNAGLNANVGISDFSSWLDSLTLDEQNKLFKCQTRDIRSTTLGDLWQRLARPNSADYKEQIYCVELIAGNIKRILDHNPVLFDTFPHNNKKAQGISLELAKNEMEEKGKTLKTTLEGNNYKVVFSYDQKSTRQLIINVFTVPDLCRYTNISNVITIISDVNRLRSILSIIPINKYPEFVKALAHKDLHVIIFNNLNNVLQTNEEKRKELLIYLLKEKLVELSDKANFEIFCNTIKSFETDKLEIIKLIDRSGIHAIAELKNDKFFKNDPEIRNRVALIFNAIGPSNFYKFIEYLDNRFDDLIEVSYHSELGKMSFVYLLSDIEDKYRLDFISAVSNRIHKFTWQEQLIFRSIIKKLQTDNEEESFARLNVFFNAISKHPISQNNRLIQRIIIHSDENSLLTVLYAFCESKCVSNRSQFLKSFITQLNFIKLAIKLNRIDLLQKIIHENQLFAEIITALDETEQEKIINSLDDKINLLIKNITDFENIFSILSTSLRSRLITIVVITNPEFFPSWKRFYTLDHDFNQIHCFVRLLVNQNISLSEILSSLSSAFGSKDIVLSFEAKMQNNPFRLYAPQKLGKQFLVPDLDSTSEYFSEKRELFWSDDTNKIKWHL